MLPETRSDLAAVLTGEHWWRYETPFPHVVAHNVFVPEVYGAIEDSFNRELANGFGTEPGQFTRQFPRDDEAFRLFGSRQWHDLLGEAMGVPGWGDVEAGIHHHEPGAASGFPHNDLNPGWFVGEGTELEVAMPRAEICNFYSGELYAEGYERREMVRSVAMLYYVANPPWSPGDGGETGIYRSASCPIDRPASAIPPVNNSMMLFHCTPYSFHGYMGNNRHPRNSVILWLYVPRAEVADRWGKESIVEWKEAPGNGYAS